MKVITYFGSSTNMLEDLVNGLIARGGVVHSLSIAYGPPPAKVEGYSYAPDTSWHCMVLADLSGVDQ